MITRVTLKRSPVCPGRDSRFTLRRNPAENNKLWVYIEPKGRNPIPADQPHPDLVDLVNHLKAAHLTGLGGSFRINEHSQVVAMMDAPPGYDQQSVHVVGVSNSGVVTYTNLITFSNGALDPRANVAEGQPWTGPRCGSTYKFDALNAPKPPSQRLDEVRMKVNGADWELSAQCGANPYPPTIGPLANFLAALRRQVPAGGRFRVNEHGRAFTPTQNTYIGLVPLQQWFRPILPTD